MRRHGVSEGAEELDEEEQEDKDEGSDPAAWDPDRLHERSAQTSLTPSIRIDTHAHTQMHLYRISFTVLIHGPKHVRMHACQHNHMQLVDRKAMRRFAL